MAADMERLPHTHTGLVVLSHALDDIAALDDGVEVRDKETL